MNRQRTLYEWSVVLLGPAIFAYFYKTYGLPQFSEVNKFWSGHKVVFALAISVGLLPYWLLVFSRLFLEKKKPLDGRRSAPK